MKKTLLLLLLVLPALVKGQEELGANWGYSNVGNTYNISASYHLRRLRGGVGYDAPEAYRDYSGATLTRLKCPYLFAQYVQRMGRHEVYAGASLHFLFDHYYQIISTQPVQTTGITYTGSGVGIQAGYSWQVYGHWLLNAQGGYYWSGYTDCQEFPTTLPSPGFNEFTTHHTSYYTITLGLHYRFSVKRSHHPHEEPGRDTRKQKSKELKLTQ